MMFSEFINEIREKNISITFKGGKLKYSGPEQFIDEEFLKKLRNYKPKLVKYFWPPECWNVMPINTEGSKAPVIMLHAGEANYSLSRYLGKDQPFYGFFYLGSEGEKIKYKNVESFAEEYIRQLQIIIPKGPYILGGFSFGGILAYEMAIRLQSRGFDIPLLILVDCEVPAFDVNGRLVYDSCKGSNAVKRHLRVLYDMVYFIGRRILYNTCHFIKINIPVKYRNGYIIWTYSRLLRRYRPNSKFKGKILLFKANENISKNKYLGWDRFCSDIQLENFTGSHKTMYNSKESIEILEDRISKFLDR